MEFILRPRQGGKTTDMLAWLRAAPEGEHRIIVSQSPKEAMRLLRENPDLESWQFVGFEELSSPTIWAGVLYGRGGHIVLGIDNIDLILAELIKWRVARVTATLEIGEEDG